MKGLSPASRPGALICPLCETGELRCSSHHAARCEDCGAPSSGVVSQALLEIASLPEALGPHACECGHPEMRLLPDGTYHCPACGSEVLPIDAPTSPSESDEEGLAYWSGWADGRVGERGTFVDNPNLARWDNPSDRLAYYRGHRAGSEAGRRASHCRPINLSVVGGEGSPQARKVPTLPAVTVGRVKCGARR